MPEARGLKLRQAVQHVTGGRLAWGLSAAGYLDPEIFRFFAAHGVELLSGFGMTEATGGITMTAPGDYRENSLGTALPGINDGNVGAGPDLGAFEFDPERIFVDGFAWPTGAPPLP